MPGGAPPRRRLEIRGELLTLREIAERYEIPGGWPALWEKNRHLIANPDLVRRWRDGLELNVPDQTTFYAPGAKGYTDYAFAE